MAKLIGTDPNQVPTNGDLGTMAYQDYDVVAPQFLAGGRRNLIINGAMQVAQRGTSSSPAPSGYLIDRFATFKSGAGTFSISQSSDAPSGFTKSSLITVTSASTPSGGDYYIFQQKVEGNNTYMLDYGSADAKTVTLSFWIKSSVTGTFSGTFRNNATDRSYAFEYTISAVSTWEYKTITIAGDTSGTWTTDSTAGLTIAFSLGQGATYATSTVGSWVSGNFHGSTTETDWIANSGATFQLTGVQLEVGSVATPFEHRSYGEELALCQRYFHIIQAGSEERANIVNGTGYDSDSFYGILHFPVEMRTSPSGSVQTSSNDLIVYGNNAATSASLSELVFERLEKGSCRLRVNNLTLTTGYSYWAELNNTANYKSIKFDAEL